MLICQLIGININIIQKLHKNKINYEYKKLQALNYV